MDGGSGRADRLMLFRLNVDAVAVLRRPLSGAGLTVALLAGQDGRAVVLPVTAAPAGGPVERGTPLILDAGDGAYVVRWALLRQSI